MTDFFWQGLTGADGHQQRTDYVISTRATPGRYEENNWSNTVPISSGTNFLAQVVVDRGGSFLWIGLGCFMLIKRSTIPFLGYSWKDKTILYSRWKDVCILRISGYLYFVRLYVAIFCEKILK